jgi:hypothetical protein
MHWDISVSLRSETPPARLDVFKESSDSRGQAASITVQLNPHAFTTPSVNSESTARALPHTSNAVRLSLLLWLECYKRNTQAPDLRLQVPSADHGPHDRRCIRSRLSLGVETSPSIQYPTVVVSRKTIKEASQTNASLSRTSSTHAFASVPLSTTPFGFARILPNRISHSCLDSVLSMLLCSS